MKEILIAILIVRLFLYNSIHSNFYNINTPPKNQEFSITHLGTPLCKNSSNFKESDIPTIFVPGILASWYSQEGLADSKVKRWIPDPITHAYDRKVNGSRNE